MTTIQEENILVPIACKFCDPPDKFVTYIEFDLVMHSHEAHDIGRGYLDTPPTPSAPSRSWSDDFRIRDAINEGRELGAELDDRTLEKLDLDYSKYLKKDKTSPSPSISAKTYVGKMPSLWSQQQTFAPIISIDEFFKDDHDKPYTYSGHKLEESSAYPIIGVKPASKYVLYYCEICQPEFANDSAVANINLSSIEHHCKYKDPERHKAEILRRLAGRISEG